MSVYISPFHLVILLALAMSAHESMASPVPCMIALKKTVKEIPIRKELLSRYDVTSRFRDKNNLVPAEKEAIETEAQEAWEFLSDYDQSVSGRKDVLFGIRGVEIRPIEDAPEKREFSVQDGKIILGLKTKSFGRVKTLSFQEIRDRWERGDQFPKDTLFKQNPQRRIWPYLNPTGSFRYSLRPVLQKLLKEAKENIRLSNPATLREMAEGKLDNVADSELEQVRTKWLAEIEKPEITEKVLDDAIQTFSYDPMPNYKIKTSSKWINVGNIHDIQVGIQAGAAGANSQPMDRPEIDVTAEGGLVNVYTIDRVRVQIDFSGKLEKLSLDRVLRR